MVQALTGLWRQRAIRGLGRFLRGRDGATAVEFAMIALPFLALLVGIFEVGLVFLVATTLEDATLNITRQLRAGALERPPHMTGADLAAMVCNNRLSWLGSACATSLEIDVRTLTQYQSPLVPAPIINGALQPQSALLLNFGAQDDIVLVRAYYPWPLAAPLMGGITDAAAGDKRHLITTTVSFRTPARLVGP